jgi:hypothetical protein
MLVELVETRVSTGSPSEIDTGSGDVRHLDLGLGMPAALR